jgi:choline dehydrogenase
MNIVRRCVTGQRQRRRTGPHGSRANPALSDPRVSPNWRIRPENAARFALPEFGWTLAVGVVRPKSRGQIRLTGPDPTDPVQIEANMLSDSDELKAAMAGVELCREIGNSAPLRPFAKREVMPGNLKGAALERFVRDAASPYWHQTGTAKMGQDPMSVVDGELKLYGTEHLRIADGSIMPRVTTGNTMASCVIIGERAAQLLRDEVR